MFYYCAKCANIENMKGECDKGRSCVICGYTLQPVPRDYLMTNGSFFKSQDVRNKFVDEIKSQETYDVTIGSNKAQIREQKTEEQKKQIEEMNEKLKEEQFQMKCPVCGKSNVQKISAVGKYAKVYAFGLLGADNLGKKWKCNVCGSKF